MRKGRRLAQLGWLGAFVGLIALLYRVSGGGSGSDAAALAQAIEHGDVSAVRVLLNRGTDPNTPLGLYPNSLWGRVLNVLSGAGTAGRSAPADLPLFRAINCDSDVVVQLLLEYGANANGTNLRRPEDRETALMASANYGRDRTVRLLLGKGADPGLKDAKGDTALFHALRMGNATVARILLEHGADVNIRNGSGETALLWAIVCRDPSVVRLLLKHGADPNLAVKPGVSALKLAHENKLPQIEQILKDAGAKQ
jgi:uncharacterized protein